MSNQSPEITDADGSYAAAMEAERTRNEALDASGPTEAERAEERKRSKKRSA